MMTIVRRRRIRVEMIRDDDGRWVEDEMELKNTAMGYYDDLFRTDTCAGGELITRGFPRMDEEIVEGLKRECTEEETLKALRNMGSFKAPGPDRYQAIFFENT